VQSATHANSESLENYFKTVWKISRAQVYRFLDCAHVLNLLQEFPIQPAHERLCRSLKRLAKTDAEIVALWQACLNKIDSTDEAHIYDTISSSFVAKVWEEIREESTSETVQESEEEKKTRKRPMVVTSPAWKATLSSSLPNDSIPNIDIPKRPSSAGLNDWKQLREMEHYSGVAPSSPGDRTRNQTESGGYSGSDEWEYQLPPVQQGSSTASFASEDFHPYHGGLTHFHLHPPHFSPHHPPHHHREHHHLYQPYARSVSPRTASPLAYFPTEAIYTYSPPFSHANTFSMDRLTLGSPRLMATPSLQAPTPHRPVFLESDYAYAQPYMSRPKSALDDLVEAALMDARQNDV
jgi:hypothetical protein